LSSEKKYAADCMITGDASNIVHNALLESMQFTVLLYLYYSSRYSELS